MTDAPVIAITAIIDAYLLRIPRSETAVGAAAVHLKRASQATSAPALSIFVTPPFTANSSIASALVQVHEDASSKGRVDLHATGMRARLDESAKPSLRPKMRLCGTLCSSAPCSAIFCSLGLASLCSTFRDRPLRRSGAPCVWLGAGTGRPGRMSCVLLGAKMRCFERQSEGLVNTLYTKSPIDAESAT